MLTDRPPSTAAIRARFLESDRLRTLEVPEDDRLQALAKSIASAMQGGTPASVRQACAEFLSVASDRKSTRLNSSHLAIPYAAFCLKKKKNKKNKQQANTKQSDKRTMSVHTTAC